MRIAEWFRGTSAYVAKVEGKSAAGREARRAARAELAAAKAAKNPAITTEKLLPDLRRQVAEAAAALHAARAAVEAAERGIKSASSGWSARIERAEEAVRRTANHRLVEFHLLLRNVRDPLRRGIVRVPAGAAPDLARPEEYRKVIMDDLAWASATIAEDHDDTTTEAEIARRVARTRLDLLAELVPGGAA